VENSAFARPGSYPYQHFFLAGKKRIQLAGS